MLREAGDRWQCAAPDRREEKTKDDRILDREAGESEEMSGPIDESKESRDDATAMREQTWLSDL